MTARPPKFPWSNQQIRDALRYLEHHAIPDPTAETIVRDLAEFGAKQLLDRRRGGRERRIPAARGEIRRLLVSAIFDGSIRPGLPQSFRSTPTAPRTLRRVCEILGQCGLDTSEATVLKDVRKLGSRNLRGK